jgi:hypothetical protein
MKTKGRLEVVGVGGRKAGGLIPHRYGVLLGLMKCFEVHSSEGCTTLWIGNTQTTEFAH